VAAAHEAGCRKRLGPEGRAGLARADHDPRNPDRLMRPHALVKRRSDRCTTPE
jgi:hypothetical protein